jgi:cadmium resistance protein CadD (predicted permease)
VFSVKGKYIPPEYTSLMKLIDTDVGVKKVIKDDQVAHDKRHNFANFA